MDHEFDTRQVRRHSESAAPARAAPGRLRVGAAGDPAEHAADRMADRVMEWLNRSEVEATVGASAPGPTPIRRAAIGAEGGPVGARLEQEIEQARRGGARLPSEVSRAMGEGFGTDLGDVRIHAGPKADMLNRTLNARAFTVGRDVFFAGGEYRPHSEAGQRLIAHELAHTVQDRSATASRTIRRWAALPANAPNLTQATEVKTITSGQCVFFLEDNNGDTLVVKGDNVPVGINQLFATVLHQVADTQSIKMRALPNTDKGVLKGLLANAGLTNNTSWANLYAARQANIDAIAAGAHAPNLAHFGGAVPAGGPERARLFHMEQIDFQPKLVAMSKAEGQAIEKVMAPGGAAGGAGGAKTARGLFGDPAHMEKLGVITAADLFLGNSDRVYSGNFGNWFVNATGAITLIDNLDAGGSGDMRQGTVATNALNDLAKANLAATTTHCINGLINGMVHNGDATAPQWAATAVKGKTRQQLMEEAFLKGLKAGRARIIKLYATGKKGARGRAAKAAATATQAGDTGRGDATQADYWETLKARARWLNSH
jgi:hypothetical protein